MHKTMIAKEFLDLIGKKFKWFSKNDEYENFFQASRFHVDDAFLWNYKSC